ncbi:hypothetical protein TNIN_80441 [Trichonephila inaurata madagascariensis]|uniref:Uncharacterized protein n=1 Tax=Trichonephila inaurata madagascariensis TaxID=2747483 RepID=A0A8X6XCG4_9ARAC|nr:hypothetical protein TNIN_80441 [Trichonephila inaurata madagascariensis]
MTPLVWLQGPEWLRLPPEFWPESKNEDSLYPPDLEYRKSNDIVQHEYIIEERKSLFDISKYSILEKKIFSQTYCDQLTSPLPSDRINQTPAFSVCGLDFAGPLYVNNFGELQNSYIGLFTCGVTRALDLELCGV